MTIRRVTASLGRTLVTLGVFTLLFVAYQLWGTALHEARAQNRLEDDFAAQLAAVADPAATQTGAPETTTTTTTTSSVSDASGPESPATSQPTNEAPSSDEPANTAAPMEIFDLEVPPPRLIQGEATARIEIPAIDLDKIVVHGVDVDDLKLGPGHFPGTPLPGQAGNAAIAGHRTTYGAPFFDLDQLDVGDQIFVETVQGRFEYRVTSLEIVEPTRVEVILPKGDNRLTFTTCHPKYSAAERLIVVSELVGDPVPGGPQDPRLTAVATQDLPDALPDDLPTEAAPIGGSVDDTAAPTDTTSTTVVAALDAPATTPLDTILVADTGDIGGGIGGGGPILPVLLWGALCLFVWTAGWILGRNWQPLPAYAIAAVFFVPALFVFYEQVARLLPENF